jgi:hypothetical protein
MKRHDVAYFLSLLLVVASTAACKLDPKSAGTLYEEERLPYDINTLEKKFLETTHTNPQDAETIRRALVDGRRVFVKTWRQPRGIGPAVEGIQRDGFTQGVKSGFPHADVLELTVVSGRVVIVLQAGQNYGAYTNGQTGPIDRALAAQSIYNDPNEDYKRWSVEDAVAVKATAVVEFEKYLNAEDVKPGVCDYNVLNNSCITRANSHFEELQALSNRIEPDQASGFNTPLKKPVGKPLPPLAPVGSGAPGPAFAP